MADVHLQISLDPASVLYFKKLSLRTRTQIPNGVIALPYLDWSADRSRLPGQSDKDITKGWMRYFAIMLAASGRRLGTDTGFVALIRVKSTQEQFSISVCAPCPDFIEPLRGPNPGAHMRNDPVPAGLDIKYKFALLDTRCPVVFIWRKATNQVLVTNEHHLQNPEQFLAIDRVNTTSGFLNFIGSLQLLSLADGTEAHYNRLPGLMRQAMTARADEWLRWFSHLADEHVLFAPSRVLIDPQNPERYFYDYASKAR